MEENNRPVNADGLFRHNIVLMSGLVTAPIIVGATTMKKTLVLVIGFFLISYFSILICRFIPRKIAYTIRIMLYALTAAVIYIPAAALLEAMFADTIKSVELYIELTVVNSFLLAKTESRFFSEPYGKMAADALVYIAGYAAAAFAVGAVREILAFGTFFGIKICDVIIPAARSPFFGFILTGMLAAVCRAVVSRRGARKER